MPGSILVVSGPTWVAPGTHRWDQTRRYQSLESVLFFDVVYGYWVVGPARKTYQNLVEHDRIDTDAREHTNKTILS